MKATWRLPGARQSEALGAALARGCPWDEAEPRLIYLSGELGAGKTTLAAALIETYAARAGEAVHIDLYRLRGSEELQQLGLRDYLNGRTLLLIEWPERAAGALPPADLEVRLELSDAPGDGGRNAHVEARSSVGEAWLTRTRAVLPNQI